MRGNQKVTPEIKEYIKDHLGLASRELSKAIFENFKVQISYVSCASWLKAMRAEAAQENQAKVDALRSKVLSNADKFANEYLAISDQVIRELKSVLDNSKNLKVESVKDRMLVAQVLNKYLEMIIGFANPEVANNIEINLKWADDNKDKPADSPSSSEIDNPGSDKV
jgi:ribosome-associated translation inhibitor RaiA